MIANDAQSDRKTQTGAANFSRKERIENLLARLFRNTLAGILDFDFKADRSRILIADARRDRERAAGPASLARRFSLY